MPLAAVFIYSLIAGSLSATFSQPRVMHHASKHQTLTRGTNLSTTMHSAIERGSTVKCFERLYPLVDSVYEEDSE